MALPGDFNYTEVGWEVTDTGKIAEPRVIVNEFGNRQPVNLASHGNIGERGAEEPSRLRF